MIWNSVCTFLRRILLFNNDYKGAIIVFLLTFFYLLPEIAISQKCEIAISGTVKDMNTNLPIPYANIYLKESHSGTFTDSVGYFKLMGLCAGNYHLSVSHIGCETVELNLIMVHDTSLTIYIDHSSQLLNEVTVVGMSENLTTQESHSINTQMLDQNSDKSLASIVENISGVSILKNGSGISKPVVHGLYGNRLTLLNNGIAQSGQQWGVDHSPEIDPLVANRITVIKGVGALEYMGSALGSVILVEPNKISEEPHLHGKARYVFRSNGRGHGINIDMQQHAKRIAWRFVGTFKRSGDSRTSSYFLRNTGSKELNMALQLEKQITKNWYSELYFSSFNTEVGILRGSQIGNLTDLESALEREVPFYTQEKFSYSIEAPKQMVNHQMLKIHLMHDISSNQTVEFTYAGQYNLRKEFDVRRSGRTELPALSLKQFTNYFETKYENYFLNNWVLKSGIQLNITDNTNIPETGILPLIPDYLSTRAGVFSRVVKNFDRTTFEIGSRYDFDYRSVAAISITLPREIIRYDTKYHNVSAMTGFSYQISRNWDLAYNLGYAQRNPEINELYSNGLHQGVSGIEEGDPELQLERSLKSTISLQGKVKEKLFLEGLFYFQKIQDYIYLNPQDEIRLTIRGAFPVFKYEQTNAQIAGFDCILNYQISDGLSFKSKYSYLKGMDISNKIPLIFMPSNNLYSEFNYQIPIVGSFQNIEVQLNSKYVFAQNNLLEGQDFVSPPAAYHLLGAVVSTEKQISQLGIEAYLRVENMLNTNYRDYLNRQRYFANDLGVSIIGGLNLSF